MFKFITLLTALLLPAHAGLLSQRNLEADLLESQATSRNFIRNSSGEQNTRGWATYADAAGSSPVDGTGGAPNVTLTRSTSSPLIGSASLLLTKDAANRQGEGASYDFTVDPAVSTNYVQNLSIYFYFSTGGTFVSGTSSDVQVYVYDVTNSTLITPQQTYLNSASGIFQTTFLPSSSSTSYRLIFHVATTSAAAWTLKVDGVTVSPLIPVLGQSGTDGTATLTTGNGFGSTNTNVRRYSSVTTSGTAFTCADDATNGASCTVNVSGLYTVNRLDRNTGAASAFGVARNDTCSSGIESVSSSNLLSYTMAPSNVAVNAPGIGVNLNAGDVIRACDNSGSKTNDSAELTSRFTIARVKEPVLPSSYIVATGGTITTDGNFRVHTFTSSGTFTITAGTGTVASLVVGGGGGGGDNNSGGGGGAGGLTYTTPGAVYGPGSYSVVVGAGGAGSTAAANAGSSGGTSSFDAISVSGGGGGGSFQIAGVSGGSGGGGGNPTAGSGTGGQGNNGGAGAGGSGNDQGGGGGGGCGSVGVAGTSSAAGAGGTACSNSITGSPVNYAAGGGGFRFDGSGGAGGSGIGGNGATSATNATSPTANTGSGGGGGYTAGGRPSTAGAAGVVILRYQFQ